MSAIHRIGICTPPDSARRRDGAEHGENGQWPFVIEPFDMEPLLVEPFDMLPFDMLPFDMLPFVMLPPAWSPSFFILSWSPVDIEPFDIEPFDIEPFDMLPDDVLLPLDIFPVVADCAKASAAVTRLMNAAMIAAFETVFMSFLLIAAVLRRVLHHRENLRGDIVAPHSCISRLRAPGGAENAFNFV
jgi:hypothetical protein